MNHRWMTPLACAGVALAADWTAPVSVTHEFKPCITYRARLTGEYLVVEAKIATPWHTFAIDNEERAAEKLAGRQSLGIDQPTRIELSGGLDVAGPWHQSPPKDFSKPDIRWYTFGFEEKAIFAAKVKRSGGSGPATVEIRGQACTDTTCKNVDLELSLPLTELRGEASELDWKGLVSVKTGNGR